MPYFDPLSENEMQRADAAGDTGCSGRSAVRSRRAPALAALLLTGLALLAFVTTSLDDAYLSFWPAYSLAHWGQILNYNGQRIEQSSSLLHTVVLALALKLTGIEISVLAWALSLGFSIGTIFTLHRLTMVLYPALTGYVPFLLACSPYFVYWSVNTLETTLAAFCYTGFLLAAARHLSGRTGLVEIAVVAALFVSVRPEAFLLATGPLLVLAAAAFLCSAGARASEGRKTAWAALRIAALAALWFALLTLFRQTVFGSPFPQPVLAKMGGYWFTRMQRGLKYLGSYDDWIPAGGAVCLLLILLGLAVTLRRWKEHCHKAPGRLLTALFLLSFFGFIILTGGDWMEAGRFFVPPLPALVLAGTVVLAEGKWRRWLPFAAAGIILFNLAGVVRWASFSTATCRGRLALNFFPALEHFEKLIPETAGYSWVERTARGHLRDIPVLEAIHKVIPLIRKTGSIYILSHQGGMIYYHLAREHFGRVVLIDGAGLSTRHLQEAFCAEEIRGMRNPMNLGILPTFEKYFERASCTECRVHLPAPDVVFDFIGPFRPFYDSLPARGFVIVYEGRGPIPGFRCEQDYGPIDMFVAVRKEFLVETPGLQTIHWSGGQR